MHGTLSTVFKHLHNLNVKLPINHFTLKIQYILTSMQWKEQKCIVGVLCQLQFTTLCKSSSSSLATCTRLKYHIFKAAHCDNATREWPLCVAAVYFSFFFIQRKISAVSADRRETSPLPHDRKWVQF